MNTGHPFLPFCCVGAVVWVQRVRRDLVCVCQRRHRYRRATLPGPPPAGAGEVPEGA